MSVLKILKDDFMKISKISKSVVVVLLLCSIFGGCMLWQSHGPSISFVEHAQQLSDDYLIHYESAIRSSDRELLSLLLGKDPDYFKNVSDEAFNDYKSQKADEIKAYRFLIHKNNEFVEDLQKKEGEK